ncbi:hypothetical protein [Lentibacillus sp. CBA3610]|uniref:hypothetical protein n=1 Tax=Lentibacillus sp. CBA3610 TaxID=2518176 RepID=UPI001596327B|nr:hypothetical protein [Lentibacillus sp. CBA3610]QKY69685.1 hypothetical protein Len3610_08820 [Lentibacillus sp. CBA3610]
MARLRWTEEEKDILRNNYEYVPTEKLEDLLPRFTIQKIRIKASQMGLKRKAPKQSRKGIKVKRWTNDEKDKLIEVYETTTNEELEQIFDRFKPNEIRRKARSLGLEKNGETKKLDDENRMSKVLGESRWSKEEEKILIDKYPTTGINGVKDLLPKKSISSIRTKVIRLGLKKEVGETWENKGMEFSNSDVFTITATYERVDK